MTVRKAIPLAMAGAAAGLVNGLFGAGGGMVLIPLLAATKTLSERELFTCSIAIIAPICIVSLSISAQGALPWRDALPFLLGSIPGGILAATLGKRIPTSWLHRALGLMILYGGVRYLC